ncbi:MAG: hypothetical protein EOP58_01405 [Sphingomonadales bacterium]|nr:MAG: hypothetical protein EOP58_01405 [Sphingomonadales bacterium]
MSLQQLEQTLGTATQPDKSLTLTGALLGSTSLGTLLTLYSADGKLVIAGADPQLSEDGNTLTVTGTTDVGTVKAAAITVTFTEPGGTLQMVAAITLPDGTALAALFAPQGNETFAAVKLDGGKLILSSLAYADPGTGRTLVPGLSLTATVAPVAILPYLQAVLPSTTRLALAGPITDFALPLFDVTTVAAEATLMGVQLPQLWLEFASVNLAAPGGDPIATGRATLHAGMTIGGITGTASANLPAGGTALSIATRFTGLTLTSFEDLVVFIGAVDPFAALPQSIQDQMKKVTDSFALTSLDFQFDTAKLAFPAVTLGVTVDLSGYEIFHLIPALSVDELDLNLTVQNVGGKTSVTYGAAATIAITNYHVILGFQTMTTGAYQLSVAQAPGDVLHLSDVLTTFVPGLTGFPAFDVQTFGLSILPDTSQYRFNAIIVSDWQLLQVPPITLTEIDVDAMYDPGLTPATSGGITGIFDMAVDDNADDDIVITLAAIKPPSAQGWMLSGETGLDQVIPIGNLITAIVKKFSTTAVVPQFLAGLGVENLSLQFDTAEKSFHFGTEILMPFADDVMLTLIVMLDVVPLSPGPGYQTTFRGTIQISQYQFDIVFDDQTGKSDTLIAAYQPGKGARQAVSLKELISGISPSMAADIPLDISIDLQDVKFVFYKDSKTNRMAFGLDVGIPIDLSNIPIVGNKLPADFTLAVTNLQGVYSTAEFNSTDIGAVNALLPSGIVPFPREGLGKSVNLTADVRVGKWTQHFQLAGNPPKSATPTPTPSVTSTTAPAPSPTPAPTGAPTPTPTPAPAPANVTGDSAYKWININKQIGIFQFDRIGAGYIDNRLSLALDAGVTLGPISFSMIGLSVGSPLDKFAPVFGLNGLGLSFSKPPIRIAGGFLKVKEPSGTSYYGQVVVQVSKIGFSALGGWSPDADPASFFLYANVNIPLGGPPYLQLKAIAGGIGINRTLILPTIEQLPGYILLPNNAPPAAGSPVSTVQTVLPQLEKYFVNQPGEYWVAAGIAFSSFEMIEAFALVTVSFGVEFQLGILGSCAMSIPTQGITPVAYIEADLVASFAPSSGLLAFEGVLSPQSYVFGGFIKIQGGFALCLWFSGENAGDFVVTVGGYYPSFDKPANYPTVPRIKIGFALGPVSVSGSAYFALTPAMLMAGISMNAVFDAGPIRAWFDASIDLLFAWSPFAYKADSYVTIGISLDLGLFTLSLHAGADLYIWGPEFGGKADVDLDVVSFSFTFGSPASAPQPVGWSGFQQSFLPPDSPAPTPAPTPAPAPQMKLTATAMPQAKALALDADPPAPAATTNVVKVTVKTGLVSSAVPGFDAIVTPNGFEIDISSTVPANDATWQQHDAVFTLNNNVPDWKLADPIPGQPFLTLPANTKTFSTTQVWNPDLDVAPMGKKGITSTLAISLLKHTDTGFSDPITDITVAPVLLPSNTAMWKVQDVSTDPNVPALLDATLVGLVLSPVPRKPDKVSDVPMIELLFTQGNDTGFAYATAAVVPGFGVTSTPDPQEEMTITITGAHAATLPNQDYHLTSLIDPWVVAQRSAIAADLAAAGFDTFPAGSIDLTIMATRKAMTDWPLVRQLGA